ncbi:hypothetical protein Taro_048017 [Colocasia esculenta]|uniref:Uncharacterized protein n=1 Tax=Colocasia esculenta TaxID=4460 RepID=A0A843X832_COLES|nr:hypothetical protein [Colocasia esculenta]
MQGDGGFNCINNVGCDSYRVRFGVIPVRGRVLEREESRGGVGIVLLALVGELYHDFYPVIMLNGLVLRQCCLQVWCGLSPGFLFVEVERQLDLSSVAARLRGVLLWFVQVRESRRLHVPPIVRSSLIAKSGHHH